MPKGIYERPSIEQRFWAKVDTRELDECWPWTASIFRFGMGYGQFQMNGRPHPAHRIAWMLAHGSYPGKSRVLHHCDNPLCCNPAHLFLGTSADNMKDMVEKGRSLRGEKNPHSSLTEDQVRAIRTLRHEGFSISSIANVIGRSRSSIAHVVYGRSWRHLE